MSDFPKTRAAFTAAVAKQNGQGGASFSATINGAEVITLSAGTAKPGVPWNDDTRATTMSVAKGWAGLVMAMLADQGKLDVDAKVTKYWPEFGVNGKQDTTVRHLLLHSAGAIGLADPTILKWDGGGWEDLDAIADGLAQFPAAWKPGTEFGYHAVTYGWLLGELVRRIDGRTLGTYFREEVAKPLGIHTAIGVPREEQDDIAICVSSTMDNPGFPLSLLQGRMRNLMRDPQSRIGRASLAHSGKSIFDSGDTLLNTPEWHAAEVPSSNGVTSAKDLARLLAVLANGGELDGIRFVSEQTLREWTAIQPGGTDSVMLEPFGRILGRIMARSMGGGGKSLGWSNNDKDRKLFGGSDASFGSGGYGGQLAVADPKNKVSIGFVRSCLLFSQSEVSNLVDAFFADIA